MWEIKFLFLLFSVKCALCNIDVKTYYTAPSIYVYWPNATIPFYINPEHFDEEQTITLKSTLEDFNFHTGGCLNFKPVLTQPEGNLHVMVFENPRGTRKCVLDTEGHPRDEVHKINLGYACLESPFIERVVMKALGFPFEHNRSNRDQYIDVLFENIEPSAINLFAKEPTMPMALQSLPYDVDSVMHFGEREFSKNGHRTIIFKDNSRSAKITGLSPTDIRKIFRIYDTECKKRDRQEQIEQCQKFPGVARKKREVPEYPNNANLRVNRDITPPPLEVDDTPSSILKELDIENEVQTVVDEVYKVSAKALASARSKYCNTNKTDLRTKEKQEKPDSEESKPDVVGIIEAITNYAKNIVDHALTNLTQFCEESGDIEMYQRFRCPFYIPGRPCRETFRSTKSGPVKYSTQHRPVIIQSTKNLGNYRPKNFVPFIRSSNRTENSSDDAVELVQSRRKREVGTNIPWQAESATESVKPETEKVIVQNSAANDTVRLKPGKTETEKVTVQNSSDAKDTVRQKRSEGSGDSGQRKKKGKGSLRMYTNIPHRDVNNKAQDDRRNFKESRSRIQNDWDDSTLSMEITTKKHHKYKFSPRLRDDDSDDDSSKPRHRQRKQRTLKKKHIPKIARQIPKLVQEQPSEESQRVESPMSTVKLTKKNEEFYNERKWPGGLIPYMIQEDPNYDITEIRRRIEEVNDILKEKTCVKFLEITPDDTQKYEDYLVIDTGADYVTGRVGGKQHFGCLELFRGGQHRQHTAMVMMAMLGFYFEIARHDRDKYIRVHLRHVRPDKLHHFEKIRSDATLALPYDYRSATHPAWQFWRKFGMKGISSVATFKSKDPDGEIMKSLGQNTQLLSNYDIIKINSIYGTKCFESKKAGDADKRRHRRPRRF